MGVSQGGVGGVATPRINRNIFLWEGWDQGYRDPRDSPGPPPPSREVFLGWKGGFVIFSSSRGYFYPFPKGDFRELPGPCERAPAPPSPPLPAPEFWGGPERDQGGPTPPFPPLISVLSRFFPFFSPNSFPAWEQRRSRGAPSPPAPKRGGPGGSPGRRRRWESGKGFEMLVPEINPKIYTQK